MAGPGVQLTLLSSQEVPGSGASASDARAFLAAADPSQQAGPRIPPAGVWGLESAQPPAHVATDESKVFTPGTICCRYICEQQKMRGLLDLSLSSLSKEKSCMSEGAKTLLTRGVAEGGAGGKGGSRGTAAG